MSSEAKPLASEIRRAVFGGVLASVCATAGWLAWLFGRAVLEDWTAIFGPMVGAFLGLIVHAAEHYHEVAHFEKHGGNWSGEEPEEPAPPRRFGAGLGRSVGLLAIGFVALTCEHVLGELMREYLVPFVASVVTLLPVGALLALAFGEKPEDAGFFAQLGRGFVAGLIAACFASAAQWAMNGKADYGGLFGWWIVVCLGLSFAAGKRPLGPFRGVFGVWIAIGVVVLFSLSLPDRLAQRIPIPQVRATILAVGLAVTGTLESPDMPAQFWMNAEREEEKHKARLAIEHPSPARDETSSLGSWLAGLIGYRPSHHQSLLDTPADLRERAERLAHPPPKDELWSDDRRDRLGSELVKGWESSLIRSWLVMMLFAFGLGLAPLVEEELRPGDYPSSRTAHNDRILFACVVAFVVLSCLVLRLMPSLTH